MKRFEGERGREKRKGVEVDELASAEEKGGSRGKHTAAKGEGMQKQRKQPPPSRSYTFSRRLLNARERYLEGKDKNKNATPRLKR